MKKLSLLLAVLLVIIMAIAGCSSANKSTATADKASSGYDANYSRGEMGGSVAPAEPQPEAPAMEDSKGDAGGFASGPYTGSSNLESAGAEMGAKIIKNGYMTVETLDFDAATSGIVRRTQQLGGFIASSNVQGWSQANARNKPMRNAHYKIRVPSNKFEQFMTDIGELGNVTRSENWGEDVSAQYFDTEARLESLNVQEDRLLTILSKAEQLSDIIELERELAQVRYEIENLTGTLRKWDNLVAFSTLEIDIYEVKEIEEIEEEPETLWDKITRSFKRSLESVVAFLEGLLIFLIGSIPVLLLLAVIGAILYWIVKGILKKNDQKIQKLQALQKMQAARQEQKDQGEQNSTKEQ
jgi:hypothetical protein